MKELILNGLFWCRGIVAALLCLVSVIVLVKLFVLFVIEIWNVV